MLELLRESPRPVGELVARTGLSQPGTSKHLRVLREAGLVVARTEAQRRIYALEERPLAELDAWLEPYRRRWERRLDGAGGAGGAVAAGASQDWRGLYEEYQRRGVPAGAPIPGD